MILLGPTRLLVFAKKISKRIPNRSFEQLFLSSSNIFELFTFSRLKTPDLWTQSASWHYYQYRFQRIFSTPPSLLTSSVSNPPNLFQPPTQQSGTYEYSNIFSSTGFKLTVWKNSLDFSAKSTNFPWFFSWKLYFSLTSSGTTTFLPDLTL